MELSSISISQTLRYMGHSGEIPHALESVLKESEQLIKSNIFPKYVYRVTEINTEGSKVKLSGFPNIIESNDLAEHLKGCSKAIIMAVTLTSEADKLISRAEITDMTKAYTLDAMCSSAIETACDIAESEIFENVGVKYSTWRYSAGYGDFAISYQSDFIRYLNAEKRIGLTVTPEYLMIPRKSVTAIIGVSDNPVESKHRGCQSCNMREKCRYSSEGTHC